MTNTEQMLHYADQLIKDGDFKAGIQLLYEVIERDEGDLRGQAVFALIRASIWDIEIYINQLVARHPYDAGLYAANTYLFFHFSQQDMRRLVQSCSAALEKLGEHEQSEINFRSQRFNASLKAYQGTYLADDFIRLWQHGEKVPSRFMQDLLSISDPKLASVFSTLIDSGLFSDDIQQLFKHKLEQLALFESVFPSQTPSSDET